MDLHHLRIFATVYSCGSFTGASNKLSISQPTISEHIKNLERELGFPLFDRLGRSIRPTAEAEILFPRALKIIDDIESLKNDLHQEGSPLAGELVIGASTIPGAYIIPKLAAAFKDANPRVRFTVLIHDSGQICRMVKNHELVIGIVGAEITNENLEYSPLFRDEMILVAPGNGEYPDRITIREMLDLPFICREEDSGTRKSVASILAGHGIGLEQINAVATLGSSSAVKEAVKAGLGCSILSRRAAEDDITSGAIKAVTVEGVDLVRDFHLVTHRKRTMPRLYQEFIRHMRDAEDNRHK